MLLNPPYSYRGAYVQRVSVGGIQHVASPAAAAFALGCDVAAPSGAVVALMPSGTLRSDKDNQLWRCIHQLGSVDILDEVPRGTFRGAYATSVIVRWRGGTSPSARMTSTSGPGACQPRGCHCIEVVRGTIPVHTLPKTAPHFSAPFIHTGDLRGGIVGDGRRAAPRRLATPGPGVLVPRVGLPRGKISMCHADTVLSDCVLLLRPLDHHKVSALHRQMMEMLPMLTGMYSGTCAQYITVSRVTEFLRQFGWAPFTARATAAVGSCRCCAEQDVQTAEGIA